MKPHLENKELSEIDLENKELGTAKRRARPSDRALVCVYYKFRIADRENSDALSGGFIIFGMSHLQKLHLDNFWGEPHGWVEQTTDVSLRST